MSPGRDYDGLPMYASSSSSPTSPISPRLRAGGNPLLTIDLSSSPRFFRQPTLPLYRTQPGSPKRQLTSPSSSSRPRLLLTFCTPPRSTRILAFLLWSAKYIVPLCLFVLLLGLYTYEPHLELAFYSRKWVKQEVHKLESLSGGCFETENVSKRYNVSEYVYGPKKVDVQAGVPLRFGMDCYNFAGTIRSSSLGRGSAGEVVYEGKKKLSKTEEERTVFHTYWRVDLASFGHRQEWMIKSFFATQDLDSTKLIIWSNGDLRQSEILRGYMRKYPESFALRVVDIPSLARGTPLEGSQRLKMNDKKAWLDGDLIRLLLLWNYGGVWVDMDSLLTRDLEPLLEHEFVTQWDCYDKPYSAFNGALLRFRQHSPYLCEAFHIMATSAPPRPGSTDWGSTLYLKLWRRLVTDSIPPFKVLPFCFNDGRSCRLDNRLPDPFKPDKKDGIWTQGLTVEEGGGLDKALQKVFAVHLHNQWEKAFPRDGWVERLLLRRYDEKMSRS